MTDEDDVDVDINDDGTQVDGPTTGASQDYIPPLEGGDGLVKPEDDDDDDEDDDKQVDDEDEEEDEEEKEKPKKRKASTKK
jgi:hypothetical protein